ncbi:MAG: UDP-N-acetylmuramoyl-L-alanyl-D-glutamate--2,6-diaminopimelate ligase [Clostridiales bacterium]|nr:UDP-N-acetylmuramoyl-L-alanyl-D-glutamate--2,6-diaminopimelate ligase [Clostridiales bacterium]
MMKNKLEETMQLSTLLKEIEYKSKKFREISIKGISNDSRKIELDNIYVCLRGLSVDGHDYAHAACNAGATCLFLEEYIEDLEDNIVQIKVDDSRDAYSRLASNWYKNPHKSLKIIAVTGTNGKTTTTHIIKTILENAGIKTAVLGTTGAYIAGEKYEQKLTTPDPMDFHYLLRIIADKKCEYVVMEVSAHALYLKKTEPVKFIAAIFTNLTQDHLDDFETMDNYKNAKKMLFQNHKCSTAIVNSDDEYENFMLSDYHGPVITYGTENDSDLFADNIQCSFSDVNYELKTNDGKYNVHMRIPGRFNVYNSLASIGVCMEIGIEMDSILDGIEKVNIIDGRMERVDCGQEYMVVVDYAHSPDSLKSVLKAACGFTKNRVISVFGCGGDRDQLKRPIMGSISNDIADFTIITSDNPRTEDPDSIIDMIEKGMRDNEYVRITDREKAIRQSLDIAQKGDVIVIAGKGHETYQDVMGKKHHFDDREIVREYFKEKGQV